MIANNIIFLIGHPGSGKSYIGKKVFDNLSKSSSKKFVLYEEDVAVVEYSEYASMKTLIENESNIQKYYDQFLEYLLQEAKQNQDNVYLVLTGGFSPLYKSNIYHHNYSIYLKMKYSDLLDINLQRQKDKFPFEVLVLENKKIIDRIAYDSESYKKFYKNTDVIYSEISDHTVQNSLLFQEDKIIDEIVTLIKCLIII